MIRTVESKQMNNEEIPNDGASILIKSEYDAEQINDLHAVVPLETMLPVKKLALLKCAPNSKGTSKKPVPVRLEKAEIYQERKRMLPDYKDLFAALLRLSDKELQRKIFDVINNHNSKDQCTVGTQTDIFYESSNTVKCDLDVTNTPKHMPSAKAEENLTNTSKTTLSVDVAPLTTEKPNKRKRKRKVSLPQANKESRTKEIVKMNKPKTILINGNLSYGTASQVPKKGSKRSRINSPISECSSEVADICEDVETNPISEIVAANIPLENGLLPIQDAVVKNQRQKLIIHIFIWKNMRKLDLNDLLTEEDEDLLQLAILNRCEPTIVQLILEQGLNPNCLDAESNTIIHLAILNDVDVNSMEQLMKHIDIKLIVTLNDDGYTPLHLAVRQDRFLLAECLINILDERTANTIFYKLEYDKLETDELLIKKQFKNYYEMICLHMDISDEISSSSIPNNHTLKEQLIQTGDRRSGNIALYYAIDNKYEHLIYFLLAHLTDPRAENLSGQDCKSFFAEYGKSLSLSLNIDNTMEKVITILS